MYIRRLISLVLATSVLNGAESISLTPIEDAFVWGQNPTTNYESQSLFIGDLSGSPSSSYLKFDLSGNIPAGSTIESAELRLEIGIASSSLNIIFGKVTSPWSESTITYSDRPSDQLLSPIIFTSPSGGVGQERHFDLSDSEFVEFLQDLLDGNVVNNGILLSGSGNYHTYKSKETGGSNGERPRLYITSHYTRKIDI